MTQHTTPPLSRQAPLRAHLAAVALMVVLLACTGCGASAHVASPHPTSPFVAAPVSVAGWTSAVANYWCGYVFQHDEITGVRAQWTEPEIHGDNSSLEYTWIGIDGWYLDTLVQGGTSGQPFNDTTLHSIWYEMYDAAWGTSGNATATGGTTAAGAQIVASIELVQQRPDAWDVLLVDATHQTGFSNIVRPGFDTPRTTADFIVEAPAAAQDSGAFYSLPDFSPITFTNMQVRIGDTWVSAASIPAQRVDMVREGTTYATASPLDTTSSFTVTKAP